MLDVEHLSLHGSLTAQPSEFNIQHSSGRMGGTVTLLALAAAAAASSRGIHRATLLVRHGNIRMNADDLKNRNPSSIRLIRVIRGQESKDFSLLGH
ncbi:MAG: hypothetical protein NTW21_19675 [Verrucomicrobia bacterium]|nr:hypothetical protein [Verrucomicrobiota bacterium]